MPARSGNRVCIAILKLACVALGSGQSGLHWDHPPKDRQNYFFLKAPQVSVQQHSVEGGASGLTAENEGTKEDGSLLNYQLPALLPTLPPER